MKKVFLFALIFLLTACSTIPPAHHEFQSMKNYDAAYDNVWKLMVSFFADRNIPLEMSDKESGIIVSKEVKIPYKGFLYKSDYCDCGSLRGLYVYHLILGKFNVTAKELQDIRPQFRSLQSTGHLNS